MSDTPNPLTDAKLDQMEKEGKAVAAIAEALKELPEDRRLPVYRAACILCIGFDPTTERG